MSVSSTFGGGGFGGGAIGGGGFGTTPAVGGISIGGTSLALTTGISGNLRFVDRFPPVFFPPVGGGTTQPTPQPTPQPPTPASPTASASDLQVMIAAIPVAQEGHLITSEYHNALRLALVAIANRLGLGTITEEITVTNSPRLLPVAGSEPWAFNYGTVQQPAGLAAGTNVRGWMELELPEGARITRMLAFARKRGAGSATFRIALLRQRIADPPVMLKLSEITIGDDDLTRGVEGDVTLPDVGGGPATIEEARIVNNREHKYLLTAELNTVAADTTAVFNAVQIVCSF
jgi:hypothetical protein